MKLYPVTGLVAGLAFLSACTQPNDPVYTQFFRPAGSIIDSSLAGEANVNNELVQTGQRDYTYILAQRFAEEVPSMVNFAFNSATLDAGAQAILRQQAAWIAQFPEARFRIYGHTDLVGSKTYNQRLGQRRANAVVSYLVSQGIDRARLEAVASFGETQPLIATEERERRNRRTVTEVSGFVDSNPLVLDGNYAQIVYRDYIESAEMESQLRTLDEGQVQAVEE